MVLWLLLAIHLLLRESVSRLEADCHLCCEDANHHYGIFLLICLFVEVTNPKCGVPVLAKLS